MRSENKEVSVAINCIFFVAEIVAEIVAEVCSCPTIVPSFHLLVDAMYAINLRSQTITKRTMSTHLFNFI